MFESISKLVRGTIEWVVPQYKDLNFSYLIAAIMVIAAFAVIVIAVVTHILRRLALTRATGRLTNFITFGSRGTGAQGADDREQQFASRFTEIDADMRAGGLGGGALAHAWRRYRRTLAFVGAPPVRSTQRPNSFVYSAFPPPSWLGFLANLFVAFGLLATFLGLVAALTFASDGMRSGDTAAMQTSLRDLLSAAASKFVTSIAGVGLSIVLRLVERLLTVDLRNRLDRLSAAIELGVRVDNDAHTAALAARIEQMINRLDRFQDAAQ